MKQSGFPAWLASGSLAGEWGFCVKGHALGSLRGQLSQQGLEIYIVTPQVSLPQFWGYLLWALPHTQNRPGDEGLSADRSLERGFQEMQVGSEEARQGGEDAGPTRSAPRG